MYAQQAPIRQLRRDSVNKVIAGVCSGISEYYGMNLIFTRVVFILLALGNGIGLIIYLLLILVIPARRTVPSHYSAPYYESAPVPSTPAPSKKSVAAYITGIISAIASCIAGLATLLTNISTIASFVLPPTPIQSTLPTSASYIQPTSIPDRGYLPVDDSSPNSRSINGSYDGNIRSDTDPDIRITRIVIDNASTQISMSYKNTTSKDVSVGVEAPENTTAFYITDSVGRRYELIGVDGIAKRPSVTTVSSNDVLHFTLTFERLDDSVAEFDVIEPGSDPTMSYWRFSGVHFK